MKNSPRFVILFLILFKQGYCQDYSIVVNINAIGDSTDIELIDARYPNVVMTSFNVVRQYFPEKKPEKQMLNSLDIKPKSINLQAGGSYKKANFNYLKKSIRARKKKRKKNKLFNCYKF